MPGKYQGIQITQFVWHVLTHFNVSQKVSITFWLQTHDSMILHVKSYMIYYTSPIHQSNTVTQDATLLKQIRGNQWKPSATPESWSTGEPLGSTVQLAPHTTVSVSGCPIKDPQASSSQIGNLGSTVVPTKHPSS